MRRRVWAVLVFCVILVACDNETVSSRLASDSILRGELLDRGRADQAVRGPLMAKLQLGEQPDSADVVSIYLTDSANTEWLKSTVQDRGWPGKSRVGAEAADAAFLIVQHSPDTAFQQAMLVLIRRAFAAGDATGQQLALLVDRVEVEAGRPQLYGTQASIADDRVILHPIADSVGVDERRAELGMMPLADYIRLLDSAYTSRDSGA